MDNWNLQAVAVFGVTGERDRWYSSDKFRYCWRCSSVGKGGSGRVLLVSEAVNSSLGGGRGLFSLERYTSLAKREETAGRFQDAMCCSCCFQVIYATAMWQEQCAVVQSGSLLLKDCLLLCSLEGDAEECNADQRLHPCGLSFS